jgi:DNA-directed RNA polymerase subunit RPC12/RpoP
MKIFDTICSGCGARFKVAESESLPSKISVAECSICGSEIVGGDAHRPKVVRLILRSETATFYDPEKRRQRSFMAGA